MATAYDSANIIIPQGGGYKAGSLYGWTPSSGSLVDFSVTRAGATATRVNSSGLIESVAANVPRIDWAEGGSCPSLLVEPQRTNLQFPSSNDNTNYTEVNTTFTASSGTSPDGTNNAALIAETTANNNHYYGNLTGVSVTNTNTYVLSVFLKKGIGATAPDIIQLTFNFAGFGAQYSNFNINLGTITATSGATAKIEAYPNGWYKCSHIVTATSTANTGGILAFTNNNGTASRLPTYVGVATSDVLYYGFDVQEGNYPTSHIPTTTTTETRNADVIAKTSIASLLGQSEGSLFIEWSYFGADSFPGISLSNGTTTYRVNFAFNTSGVFSYIVGSNGTQALISGGSVSPNTYYKNALRYAVNDFALYADGSSIGTDTSGVTFTNELNRIVLNSGAGSSPFYGRIRSLAVYDIALTNTELANLTT